MSIFSEVDFYFDRPVHFVRDIVKAEPDDIQGEILDAVARHSMTSVRSGHGIGKSTIGAWLILWFLFTRPFPKIPCTAPTMHQLYDILWAEVAKWMRQSAGLSRYFEWTQEKVYMKGFGEEWFAVPRTATTGDALQGFHAEYILFLIDEASGVSDKNFEPVLGATSTAGSKLVAFGNPTRLTGFFYDSHHKNRAMFKTFHIDGRNSKRVSFEFVQTIAQMYGEDSDVFRVRVAGEFPKALPDSFIPMEWCEKASARDRAITEARRIDIGVDVARFGDDDSVITTVFDRAEQHGLDIYHHNDTMQLTGLVVQAIYKAAREHPRAAVFVKVDCDGMGVGVYDRLAEQRYTVIDTVDAWRKDDAGNDGTTQPFELEIVECHFGGEGGTVSGVDVIEYANSTGVMWGTVRQALQHGRLALMKDDRQISQLSNRKYTVNSAGKIELERKDAMKKRGVTSPDIGDALALAMYQPSGDYHIEVGSTDPESSHISGNWY